MKKNLLFVEKSEKKFKKTNGKIIHTFSFVFLVPLFFFFFFLGFFFSSFLLFLAQFFFSLLLCEIPVFFGYLSSCSFLYFFQSLTQRFIVYRWEVLQNNPLLSCIHKYVFNRKNPNKRKKRKETKFNNR